MSFLFRALFLCLVLIIAGCGDQATTPVTPGAEAVPKDPELAKLYEQTCKSCHASGLGGAPQAGNKAAWADRVEQGMDVLLEHTIYGYKGMPPLGACMDCCEQDFENLIRFMAVMEDEA